jgi:TetR/AcrR family transcriptional regulator, regulator of mycofactocin system
MAYHAMSARSCHRRIVGSLSRGPGDAESGPIGLLGWRCCATFPAAPSRHERGSMEAELATESLDRQLRVKRSEMMLTALESVALRLFEQRGFDITVDQIASEAQISVRTFYRYFPAKEDVLQVRIDRRSEGLRAALSARPTDEAPLHSLRVAIGEVVSAEDEELVRRWSDVIAATPSLLKGVLGGIQLKGNVVIAEFLGARLGVPSDALVPTMLAAAVGGVIQAAQTRWYLQGGDLATAISDGLEVLERGIGGDPKMWQP